MQTLAACEPHERISRAFYREALNLALEAVTARARALTIQASRQKAAPRRRAKTAQRNAEKKR